MVSISFKFLKEYFGKFNVALGTKKTIYRHLKSHFGTFT